MGKICLKCGNELNDNAKFCSKCGSQYEDLKAEEQEEESACQEESKIFARIVGKQNKHECEIFALYAEIV